MKKNNKYFFYAALFFGIVFIFATSCKKTGISYEPITYQEIFPLSTGYHWDFITTTNDTVKVSHVNDVVKDTLMGGEKWFILTYDHSVQTICRNNSSGWWFQYQGIPQTPPTPSLYYRYPASVNEVYMTPDSTKVTVLSVNDLVTVPAGKFTCFRYHMVHYREGYVCDEYLSPGTGLVLHVIYAPGEGITKIAEVTELERFIKL